MTKYRLRSNFEGNWEIQYEREVYNYQYDANAIIARQVKGLVWERTYAYPSNMKYATAKKELETLLAKEAYVPTILEPPLPKQDPKKQKSFFKSLFNFS